MAPPTPDDGGLQTIVRQRLISDVFDASCGESFVQCGVFLIQSRMRVDAIRADDVGRPTQII